MIDASWDRARGLVLGIIGGVGVYGLVIVMIVVWRRKRRGG